jgi:hypothetical protein
MHTVHYTKHFLTGNLTGFDVKCSISYPNATLALAILDILATHTPDHPGRDCVTGAQYYVTGAHSS